MKGRKTGGRMKGVQNKTTREVKAVIAELVRETAPKLAAWLSEIEDPYKRFDIYLKVLEFDLPKLARTEHTTDPSAKGDALVTVLFTAARPPE